MSCSVWFVCMLVGVIRSETVVHLVNISCETLLQYHFIMNTTSHLRSDRGAANFGLSCDHLLRGSYGQRRAVSAQVRNRVAEYSVMK